MARRVHTEQVIDNGHTEDQEHFDIEGLSDEEDQYGAEEDYGQENAAAAGGAEGKDGGAEDLINYKGIYFNDDPGQKFTDPETGAHFEYKDMCRRLNRAHQKRNAAEGIPTEPQIDPLKQQQLKLAKEKEDFLKSMGVKKQNALQQVPQPQRESKGSSGTNQTTAQAHPTQYGQPKQQQQVKPNVQTAEAQLKENNKQLIAQMLAQQHQQLQLQQQQQQLQQQQVQQPNQFSQSQSKWRSKSGEKQGFLNSSQKINSKAKVMGEQMSMAQGNAQIQKMLGTKQSQQHQENLQRGKTPEQYNKVKVQMVDQPNGQQNIQKIKMSLGYNESTLSTGSNVNHIPANNKTQPIVFSNHDYLQKVFTEIQQRQELPGLIIIKIFRYLQWRSRQFTVEEQQDYIRYLDLLVSSQLDQNAARKTSQNKNQTMKKGQTGMSGLKNQIPELEHLMAKFSNSLAIQNIGGYGAASTMVGTGSKSRNMAQGSFKTTASIGSAKGMGNKQLMSNTQAMLEGAMKTTSLKSTQQNPLGLGQDSSYPSHAKKNSGSSKFNNSQGGQNSGNLYSMIYQNRTKNLVSNYLKGIDTTVRGSGSGQIPQKIQGNGSSRNQNLMAPTGTKKTTRNTMVGTLDGMGDIAQNKSLIGRYF